MTVKIYTMCMPSLSLHFHTLNNSTLELLHCHVICQLKNLTSNFLRQEVTMALNSKTISSTFEMDQIHDIN